MLKFDKEDLLFLLRERGFRAVDMKSPIGIINGRERRAHPRRAYDLKRLLTELKNLWTNGVRVIGVYRVSPISDVWNLGKTEPDGVYMRVAYYADFGVRGGEHMKGCKATEGCDCADILYQRNALFGALKIPKEFMRA